jgi:hypothetical protein
MKNPATETESAGNSGKKVPKSHGRSSSACEPRLMIEKDSSVLDKSATILFVVIGIFIIKILYLIE